MMKNVKTILLLALLTLVLGMPTTVMAQMPGGGMPGGGMPPSGMKGPGGKGQMPPKGKEKKESKKKKKEVALEHPKVGQMYMLGFSASFSDSVAFLTDVQLVDSIHFLPHNKLVDRNLYSMQLEEYVENVAHIQNSTNAVYFSKKKKSLDKKKAKLNKMYKNSNEIALVQLHTSDFSFKPEEYVAPVEIVEEDEPEETAAPANKPTKK